jgi:hypothetical protein
MAPLRLDPGQVHRHTPLDQSGDDQIEQDHEEEAGPSVHFLDLPDSCIQIRLDAALQRLRQRIAHRKQRRLRQVAAAENDPLRPACGVETGGNRRAFSSRG